MRLLEIDCLPTIPLDRHRATRALWRDGDATLPDAERLTRASLTYVGEGTCEDCQETRELWRAVLDDAATDPSGHFACPPCTVYAPGGGTGWVWACLTMRPATAGG